MAGANEAEQMLQGAEQTPRKPETATGQVPGPAAGTTAEPATEQTPEQTPQAPGFGERGRMRRRARFLRKARELAYRDLGGLVFDLHRFGQRNDQLVLAKLSTLGQLDTELRELEEALRNRRPVMVLREVGIAACPRCAAIHGSDDRFCPGCGLAFDAHADRPISTAPVSQRALAAASAPTSASPAPAPAPAPAPVTVSAPPVKPTAAPVAAKPASPQASPPSSPPMSPGPSPPAAPERKEPERADEDEPTQILRPPATGA